MAELKKPSNPTVSGKTVSVDSIAGAVKYTLYRVRYVLKNAVDPVINFLLRNGRSLTTKDGLIFTVKDSNETYTSSYTGEQIDEAVRQALSGSSK